MRRLLLAVVCAAALSSQVFGQRAGTPLESAHWAWDRGEYVAALQTYLDLLASEPDEGTLRTVALQTGELFRTTELTTDGDAPQFSRDGRHIAYESGSLLELDRTIHLVSAADPTKRLATLPGTRGVFSPDGATFAYLRIEPSDALRQAQAAVNSAAGGERTQRLADFNGVAWREARVMVRDLRAGREAEVDVGALRKSALASSPHALLLAAAPADGGVTQIYVAEPGGAVALTSGETEKILGDLNATGTALLFTARPPRGAGRGGRGAGAAAAATFGIIALPSRAVTMIEGSAPAFSPDGQTLTYVARQGAEYRLMVAPVTDPAKAAVVRRGPHRIDAPAVSPDGARLAFQMMPKEDWEIFTIARDGSGEVRVTREIQHDVLPRFLDDGRLLGMIGESRHRRSHVYDVSAPTPWETRTRVFHNNTVRTIAPEYAWVPAPDGQRLLIVAERDGDTVSPERGLYLVDLAARVTAGELRQRLRSNLEAEQALRTKTERLFAPIAGQVRQVLAGASIGRVFAYQKGLFDFDSKHITQPGNALAGAYLFDTYKSFGYEPEYQWFAARNALGGRTANVLATLRGTENPELVYVVSSHYDSVAAGPGADDDSSGTAALLEAARLLAKHPQPATIVFASFTGEEAGLLGSREYVRQAVENNVQIVGALNNDMIGWANDHRLDNTIRYSNPGIRDVQHGAAMHFTDLITYDALYYKSTDAAAYYEAYGDIVGGIGSYPVLGNPHYHQPHDVLETINHRLVTEVSKTTVATLMLLASSPSRITGLTVDRAAAGSATVSWTPSPERGVKDYVVAYGPAENPAARQTRVSQPTATVPAPPGTVVMVKAINGRGLEGWDWARVTVR